MKVKKKKEHDKTLKITKTWYENCLMSLNDVLHKRSFCLSRGETIGKDLNKSVVKNKSKVKKFKLGKNEKERRFNECEMCSY